jgi:ABC-type Fe3+-siderophore transport system permease subunit
VSQVDDAPADVAPGPPPGAGPRRGGPAGLRLADALGASTVLAGLVVLLLLCAGWHLTQGTSGIGFAELWHVLVGEDRAGAQAARDVLVGSRLPRMAAAVTVGFALGVAGALLQSLSRNAIAAPDTLAVTGGAYFAVTLVAALGVAVPLWGSTAVAFGGGLAASLLVVGLAGAGISTTRLVLAGSAVALALQSATSTLLLLFEEETTSLFAWGSGSLSQLGLTAFRNAAPIVVGATALGIGLARRLDLLALGDDTAGVLGVPVRATKLAGTLLAVLLTAASVTLAGPIGFVGLFAPVLVRLLAHLAPGLLRHALLLPAAGLVGAVVVVLADALVRALLGADEAIVVPTGVTTTIAGSVLIVVLARRARDAGPASRTPGAAVAVRSRRRFVVVVVLGVGAVAGTAVLGLLAGHTWLRTGDIGVWLGGDGSSLIRFALDERSPRVAAALVAGGALALSGSLVQATCRNPLAEPGILGITGGAGLAAVIGVTTLDVGRDGVLGLAVVGALAAFAIVYLLSWRGGLQSDRLIIVGIGVWYGTISLTTYLLVRSNPWDTPRIFTWLSGTTYGRTWDQVAPAAVVLLAALPLAFAVRRDLDLIALDDDAPRLAGIRLERVRLVVLVAAALLAATSAVAVGVVGFVGLVAPHAARALVGPRHVRSIPVAVLLGAVLLGMADTLGRTVIAPSQLPAGLAVALLGAPYFVYLLARSRA